MLALVRVSTVCNLACGFCAYDRRIAMPRVSLEDAQVERLIDLLAGWQRQHRPAQPAMVSWLGGEPLLWAGWQRCSQRAQAAGLRVSATSNGTTLGSAEARAAVLDCLDELTLSVDAPGPAHDALRGWRGGYARVLAAIAALRAAREQRPARLRLRVNVVLMRSHIDDFNALALALADAGVDEISCNVLGGRDRPEFYARQRIDAAAWQRFCARLPALRARLSQRGVDLLGDVSYWARLRDQIHGIARPVADCAPGQAFVFCDERARLSPCAFTSSEYGVPLEDVDRLDRLPALFLSARQRRCAAVCGDCPSTQVFGKFASDVDLGSTAASAAIAPVTA